MVEALFTEKFKQNKNGSTENSRQQEKILETMLDANKDMAAQVSEHNKSNWGAAGFFLADSDLGIDPSEEEMGEDDINIDDILKTIENASSISEIEQLVAECEEIGDLANPKIAKIRNNKYLEKIFQLNFLLNNLKSQLDSLRKQTPPDLKNLNQQVRDNLAKELPAIRKNAEHIAENARKGNMEFANRTNLRNLEKILNKAIETLQKNPLGLKPEELKKSIEKLGEALRQAQTALKEKSIPDAKMNEALRAANEAVKQLNKHPRLKDMGKDISRQNEIARREVNIREIGNRQNQLQYQLEKAGQPQRGQLQEQLRQLETQRLSLQREQLLSRQSQLSEQLRATGNVKEQQQLQARLQRLQQLDRNMNLRDNLTQQRQAIRELSQTSVHDQQKSVLDRLSQLQRAQTDMVMQRLEVQRRQVLQTLTSITNQQQKTGLQRNVESLRVWDSIQLGYSREQAGKLASMQNMGASERLNVIDQFSRSTANHIKEFGQMERAANNAVRSVQTDRQVEKSSPVNRAEQTSTKQANSQSRAGDPNMRTAEVKTEKSNPVPGHTEHNQQKAEVKYVETKSEPKSETKGAEAKVNTVSENKAAAPEQKATTQQQPTNNAKAAPVVNDNLKTAQAKTVETVKTESVKPEAKATETKAPENKVTAPENEAAKPEPVKVEAKKEEAKISDDDKIKPPEPGKNACGPCPCPKCGDAKTVAPKLVEETQAKMDAMELSKRTASITTERQVELAENTQKAVAASNQKTMAEQQAADNLVNLAAKLKPPVTGIEPTAMKPALPDKVQQLANAM